MGFLWTSFVFGFFIWFLPFCLVHFIFYVVDMFLFYVSFAFHFICCVVDKFFVFFFRFSFSVFVLLMFFFWFFCFFCSLFFFWRWRRRLIGLRGWACVVVFFLSSDENVAVVVVTVCKLRQKKLESFDFRVKFFVFALHPFVVVRQSVSCFTRGLLLFRLFQSTSIGVDATQGLSPKGFGAYVLFIRQRQWLELSLPLVGLQCVVGLG